MNVVKKWILIVAMSFCSSTFANTFGTDMTDLWWNASESGWGVTVTHQGEIVFLTFFVYGTDNRPVWYTGQASYAGITSQGQAVYSGSMFQTSGPWLGTFFNPNAVGVRQVGTVNFTAFVSSATLTYSVDGTVVNKTLTRQTFRNNNLTGEYAGVSRGIASGCANPLNNGTSENVLGVSISISGSIFAMVTNDGAQTCNYTGNYTQAGRMGRSQGSFSCPGQAGTFDFIEVEAGFGSITARTTLSSNVCSKITGQIALVKRL